MNQTTNPTSRRGMLLGAAAATSAAAAVVVLPKIAPPEAIAEPLKAAPVNGGGYSLTEHVKHYYRTAQI